jgi:hypothetical protein
MIMNALLTERTTARPPWAGLRPSRAGPLLNMVQKALSALVARHLRKVETQLVSFDLRMLKAIGLDRSEIGSVPMDKELERAKGVWRQQDRANGFGAIRVHFDISADASIKALVAQSQKRSGLFDIITNPTNVLILEQTLPCSAPHKRSPIKRPS